MNYWEQRKAYEMYENMAKAEKTADTIGKVYHKASNYLTRDMDQIFERFAKKHRLSKEEAAKILAAVGDKHSLDDIKRELAKAPAGSDKRELLAELEAPAYKARLDRLEDKKNQIDQVMQLVYGQEKKISTSHYLDFAKEAYNKSMFGIQKQAGVGFSFAEIDKDMIDKLLQMKWSGKNYSKRIWGNTEKLADTLKTELMTGLLTGEREQDISERILYDFAAGANNARRLVRTESCYLASEMDMKAYEECGIETYVFVATLDLKTSEICASLDGKRFPVKDKQSGVNAPPMHPWCRSTTICDISDEELAGMKRRAKNPETGKPELVPGNMTYEEWKKKYVDKNEKAVLNENKIKNRGIDQKQYSNYKEKLGKYAPKSLEKFQTIKYSNETEYGVLKAQYKGMGYYEKALEKEPEITEKVKEIANKIGVNVEGIENRIKSKDSYLRKIRTAYEKGKTEYEIKDIIRYTYTDNPNTYVENIRKTIESFEKEGYNTVEVKNYWLDEKNPYNGINTVVKTEEGQMFELQYHTKQSYELKNGKMHELYEKQRVITDEYSDDYIKLSDEMFELSKQLEVPSGIERVK